VSGALKSAAHGFNKEFTSQQGAIWVAKEWAVEVSGMITGEKLFQGGDQTGRSPGCCSKVYGNPFLEGVSLRCR
jgi:hypothetical protein